MDQLRKILASLTLKQKITIGAAVIAVAATLFGISTWTKERDFKPLYTNLAAEDAGAVVSKLKESTAEYRVADGGASILVPSAKVAETRLQMAAAGIPKTGRIGYELFDKTNFGATDFAEQVNYHRALEGELERSVSAIGEVEQARVHLTLPKNSLFLENRQPAKASVLLKLRPGAQLAQQNVMAITHLLASAVEGLNPDGVSVLDMHGNLLSRPRKAAGLDGLESSDSALEYRQKLEKDLVTKINATLEPVLGPDKFRAGISVDCDFTSGEQSEETFDPSKSVMVTAQKTEDISGSNSANGVPGTASNMPRPTSRPGVSGNGTTRRTESITYQSSRLVKRLRLPQGGVKRMSVAILLDQAVRWEGPSGQARRVLEPPSPEKLKIIKDLVAGATGLQPERGDQLIVESLPFESTLALQAPTEPGKDVSKPANKIRPSWFPPALQQIDPMILTGIAAGFLLAFLGAAAFFFMRSRKQRKGNVDVRKELPPAPDVSVDKTVDLRQKMEQALEGKRLLKEQQTLEALNALKIAPVRTQKTDALTKHIGAETKRDPQTVANIIRTWISER